MGTQGSGPEFRLGGPGQPVLEPVLEPGRQRAEQEGRSGFREGAKAKVRDKLQEQIRAFSDLLQSGRQSLPAKLICSLKRNEITSGFCNFLFSTKKRK